MLFNSVVFFAFLLHVFIVYWSFARLPKIFQNLTILTASYVFYGWWDWRFLSLIAASSLLDFIVGKAIYNAKSHGIRRGFLWLSLGFNLGMLFVFKYLDFFIDSFIKAFNSIGFEISEPTLYIILPVGISFYTFQTLSYSIDIYKGKLKPTKNWVDFFAFVSFFPQLVAGPIERAYNLLPQFNKTRRFDYEKAKSGAVLMLWGFFKKMVIADNLAYISNEVFNNYGDYSGITYAIGTICFAFQIYADFSGYSDIAIGCARLFNFDLMINFRTPYFSGSLREFWSRWHISLSTWFRDYVYIPMGGSKKGKGRTYLNLLVTFLVSGFWHGASWTFVIWGGIHGIFLMMERAFLNLHKFLRVKFLAALIVFAVVCMAWIFFRASDLEQAWIMLSGIFRTSPHHLGDLIDEIGIFSFFSFFILLGFLVFTELCFGWKQLVKFYHKTAILRHLSYVTLFLLILFFGVFQNKSDFIYFQF